VLAVLLFALLLSALGHSAYPFGSSADGLQLPGDHYRWLLQAPFRPYLSNAAQMFLQIKYGGQAFAERWKRSAQDLSGQDQRVNDPSQDSNPSITTQSETTVAVYRSRVLVGWNNLAQLRRTSSISGYGYSEDGGQTFTDAGVIPPVFGGVSLGDPSLAVDSAGNFYYGQVGLNDKGLAFIGVAKSTDGGRTFYAPIDASRSVTSPNSFQDKPFIAVDTTGGPDDGHVYVAWTNISRDGGLIAFARSLDGGKHFQDAIPLSPELSFGQGAIPAVGPHGEIYVAWEDMYAPGIRITKSVDGGRTFGADGVGNKLIARVVPIGEPGSPATCNGRRILKGYIDAAVEFPSLAVNPVNGEIYVVYDSHPPGPDESDIYFVRSSDGGRTWSSPERVNDDRTPNDQFMPAIAVAGNGTLSVIWYDRRNDPDNLKFDVYQADSTDGGRTWEPNERVSSVSSNVPPLNPNFDLGRPCYMGDYIGITADARSFYLAWGDNRDQGLTWRTRAPMPTPREATANVAVGDTVFVIGGSKLGYGEFGESGVNEAYQVDSDRWRALKPMPTPRSGAAAVALDLSIYVLGGSDSRVGGPSGAFERYDIITDSWTELPPLPTPRYGLGAAIVGNKIYAIGGQDCSSDSCGNSLDLVEVYDLRTGRWSKAASMPTPRTDLTATIAFQGKIYVFGGFSLDLLSPLRTVEVYDPATDSWATQPHMPYYRGGGSAAVCGDKILVFGGFGQTFTANQRRDQLYDPVTFKWTNVASTKFERIGVQAAVIGDTVYVIGGSLYSSIGQAGANEAFDCRNLGYTRPDPDVFFAIRAVPLPQNSSLREPAAVQRSARPEPLSTPTPFSLEGTWVVRLGQDWLFNVHGSGIEALQVELYDLAGRRVYQSAEVRGSTLAWHGLAGPPLANGVYFYRITVRGPNGQRVAGPVRAIVLMR
jgi:N-acetylneuraminic acid mutarotase